MLLKAHFATFVEIEIGSIKLLAHSLLSQFLALFPKRLLSHFKSLHRLLIVIVNVVQRLVKTRLTDLSEPIGFLW